MLRNNLIRTLLIVVSLCLPIMMFGQTAEECYKKGGEYYNNNKFKKAFKWYQKAAIQGFAKAQTDLGYMYQNGCGVMKNKAKAVEWFQKAANQGVADAQNKLGNMYYDGDVVTQDYSKAIEWYQKAAYQENAYAQTMLGVIYEYGRGVPQNYQIAKTWYQKALENDPNFTTTAKHNLARVEEKIAEQDNNNNYSQNTTTITQPKAEPQPKVEQKTIEKTVSTPISSKVTITNVDNNIPVSGQTAEECNKKGSDYYYGRDGVSQDYSEAVKWYRKAAEQGYAKAQINLGYCYQYGRGVTKDYTEALKWYRKAAEQGYALAMKDIGTFYENGQGVPQDYQTAKTWYQKALDQNPDLTEAKNNLARIEKIIAEQTNNNNNYAQNTITTTQPKVEPKPKMEPKVEMVMVDTDIPIISRVNRNTFAIIIANEDYMDEAKVDFAKNDGEVFKSYCRKTLGLPETNIHYMPNATLAKMFGELDWLRQVCEVYKGEANVIFYYSGHGFPDEKSHEAYIIPVDGNKRLLRTCFNVSELYETLGSMPSKRVTVLMDACFSGAKRSGDMLASAKGIAIKAKAGIPKGNMVVMSAAQGDETAYFHQEAKHGLFTYYLLKKLKETRGSVTLGELSSYIQDEVSKYSIVVNGKIQTPTVQASDKLIGSWRSLNF